MSAIALNNNLPGNFLMIPFVTLYQRVEDSIEEIEEYKPHREGSLSIAYLKTISLIAITILTFPFFGISYGIGFCIKAIASLCLGEKSKNQPFQIKIIQNDAKEKLRKIARTLQAWLYDINKKMQSTCFRRSYKLLATSKVICWKLMEDTRLAFFEIPRVPKQTLVIYDSHQKVQAVGLFYIVNHPPFNSKTNPIPEGRYIYLEYLLTNPLNLPIQENTYEIEKTKGAGSAAMNHLKSLARQAREIPIRGICLSSTRIAEPFYQKHNMKKIDPNDTVQMDILKYSGCSNYHWLTSP